MRASEEFEIFQELLQFYQADDFKIVTLITDWHAGTAAELRAPRAEPQIKNGRMDMS